MHAEIQHLMATVVETLPGNCMDYAGFDDPDEGKKMAVADRVKRQEAVEKLLRWCGEGARQEVMASVAKQPEAERGFLEAVLEPDAGDPQSTVNC